uniref:Chitinase domain-containing protein 1 n=1 Tax=Cicer arietinum TaxID=3827 RepID=A0A076L2H1_CICAR|nr:chitinase [Cicer arietinum]
MAKKRDHHRSTQSSGHRENQIKSPSRREKQTKSDSASGTIKIIGFFIVSSLIAVVAYWLTQSSPSQHNESYVYQRGLVTTNTNYQDILNENTKVSENISKRHYTHPVLGYITPCQQTSLVLEGRHNADRGWISELKKTGEALILPRFVLEVSPEELLRKKKQRNKAVDLIVTECKWAAYGILHDPSMRNLALQFVKQLGDALHSISSEKISGQKLQLVYVIGPPSSEKLLAHDFGPKDLETLSEVVDGFSLMTYDFSNPHNPGPNAPLKWIQIILQMLLGASANRAQNIPPKIFLGINFYGNDFSLSRDSGGGAIIGRDYLALLEKHRPVLQWDKNSGEHVFFYTDDKDIKHAVFYPSLKSISLRLEEARSWECGISIWEIGQGYLFIKGHVGKVSPRVMGGCQLGVI